MKRLFSLILLASIAAAALPALAAPVFMLQFGSFETKAEADEKLAALKSKHAGVLSRMEASVREVALPPDNLTVYRTQAGPIATRADAQSVCAQMASNGDECYVVETAMMQPAMPATTQVAKAVEAVAPASAPTTAPTTAPLPGVAEPAAAVASAPSAALAPGNVQIIPTIGSRDEKNIEAMRRVSTPMPAPISAPQATTETDAMQQQLAMAVEKQKAVETSSFAPNAGELPSNNLRADEKPAAKAPVADRSLWDRLFGDDAPEEKKPAAALASQEDAVQAAPVEPMEVASVAPMEADAIAAPAPVLASVPAAAPDEAMPVRSVAPADASTVMPSSTLVVTPPAPVTAEKPVAAPVVAAPVVTQAEPFRLPPPPAPLVGKSRPVVVAPAAVAMPAPLPVAVSTPMPSPVIASAPTNTGAVPTTVQVEEAKRVPLTQGSAPAAAPAFPPPMPATAMAAPTMPSALSPSATIGQKTLWAQIGAFANAQSALAFWDSFRRVNPDFPVVRVRVTTPLMAQQRGLPLVNLRVGPFAREGFITNLCATMQRDGLQCGSVTDMGVASAARPRGGLLPTSRYSR